MSKRLWNWVFICRLNRPVGMLLLLWPTLWALWIAGHGRPAPWPTLILTLGVVVMRAAGCVINDIADRDFDRHVKRTRERPLATGAMTITEALLVFVVLMLLALALVLTLNPLAWAMAVPGALIAIAYPFMKRFTHLPQAWLGLAFSWGIPMAFAAVQNALPPVCWLLLIANSLWVIAYDTLYAMVDRDDDLKIGIRSTAILFADWDRVMVAGLTFSTVIMLAVIGFLSDLNGYYFFGLGAAFLFAGAQMPYYWQRDRDRCFKAFVDNNWFGALVFAGLLIAGLPSS